MTHIKKGRRESQLSSNERNRLRAARRENIVKPGEVSKKKRENVVLPTIEAKRKESGIQKFAKTKVGRVLTSPKTTVALAATLAGGAGLAAARGVGLLGRVTLGRTAATGTTFGRIPLKPNLKDIAAGKFGATTATFARVGSTVKFGQVAVNAKNIGLATNVLKKVLSKPAMLFYGSWASSVLIGLWATAEAPESIAFPEQKFLITDAVRTGDWSLVDEAEVAKYEVLTLSTWEKILRLSPLSFLLINKKIQGALAGAKITSKIIDDKKKQQEEGTTEEDYWSERRKEQAEDDKAAIDYYNEQRELMIEWEREAKKDARNEDAAFWRKEKVKQRKLEAEDRKAIADFWLEYKKETIKMASDNRPSNLNFGLL